jgi:hypothetical protein
VGVSVRSLIAAHKSGDQKSLRALAVTLATVLGDTPEQPTDPIAHWSAVEDAGAEAPGTWQEVRAAHDYGDLTDAEYAYLATAVEALTRDKEHEHDDL